MAAEVLFAKEDDSGTLQFELLPLSAVSEETHRGTAVATSNEVEEGINITDHYRAEQDSVVLRCVVTNTPLRSEPGAESVSLQEVPLELPARTEVTERASLDRGTGRARPGTEERKAAPQLSARVYRSDVELSRVEDAWALLDRARNEGWTATVTTRLKTYSPMLLTSHETVRAAKHGSGIVVDLTFVSLRTAATELVDAAPARPRNRRQQNRGSQATEANNNQPQQSLWYRAAQASGILGNI